MKKKGYILLLLLSFSLLGEGIVGQELLRVVEKKESSSLAYAVGNDLKIVGEKAEISIEVHAKSTIEIEVSIIAKNIDKSLAENDLKKMHLLRDKVGKTYFLRNYIEIKNASEKPTSGLKVVYTIKVPPNCPITVKNYFGKVNITGLKAPLEIESEFTPINLEGISGKVGVESTYGDLVAENSEGWMNLKMNRAKTSVKSFKGDLDINCILAEVVLENIEVGSVLRLQSERSTVDLSVLNEEECYYHFELEKVDWANTQGLSTKNEKGKVKVEEPNSGRKALIELLMDTGSLDY